MADSLPSMLEIVGLIEDKDAPTALIDMAACGDLDMEELRAAYKAKPGDYLRGCIASYQALTSWMYGCQQPQEYDNEKEIANA